MSKKRFVPKNKRKTNTPEKFVCYWKLVKDTSFKGPLRFVIQDDDGNETKISITDGVMTVNGSVMYDAAALSFISRTAEDFERLFVAAAKKYDEDNALARDLYIAKLADISGVNKKTATMSIPDSGVLRKLSVERTGENPRFSLDGVYITEKEGREFIRAHYSSFLTSYKSAVKSTEDSLESAKREKRNTIPETLKSTKTEDGRVVVDVSGFLDSLKPQSGRRKGAGTSKLREEILNKKKRGYVE